MYKKMVGIHERKIRSLRHQVLFKEREIEGNVKGNPHHTLAENVEIIDVT